MLKKTITYEDFDGGTQTETFYFNLTQAELVKLEVSSEDGFAEYLQGLVKTNNREIIMDTFERIILMSYGEKSEDGKKFEKEDLDGRPLSRGFKQTAAYSALFVELTTDAGAAGAFVAAVIPASLSAQLPDVNQLELPEPEENVKVPDEPEEIDSWVPAGIKTKEELENMSQPELLQYFESLRGE